MSKLVSVDELFEGRHFDREVIILCVRWYLRYKLSFRDLVEMMAERGLSIVESRGDLREDPRQLDVLGSRGRSRWQDRGLRA